METGIEKLKKAIGAVIGLGTTVTESLEDDKISVSEWGKISFKSISLALALKDFKLLKIEFKDLTDAEKEEIITYVNENFDLPNDATEAMIEEAFEILFKFATSFKKAA